MNLETLIIKALEAVNRDDKETVYCRVRDMANFWGAKIGIDYCHNPRHITPHPLPCQLCEEECG